MHKVPMLPTYIKNKIVEEKFKIFEKIPQTIQYGCLQKVKSLPLHVFTILMEHIKRGYVCVTQNRNL